MFQHFDDRSHRGDAPARLAALRGALKALGLSGFLVPHADEHQSEYLPPSAERLAWLTGFTGSAGLAMVLADAAALFVDGRYTLQAEAQIDRKAFAIASLIEPPPADWLAARLQSGDRIGFDPWLMTLAEVRRYQKLCSDAGAELVPVAGNPIDAVWADRPAPPLGQVALQPLVLAGESAADKLKRLAAAVAAKKADAAVLSLADSVAWAFNIRGTDIAHNPVPLAFALIRSEGRPTIYVDGRKLGNSVRDALADLADIAEPSTLPRDLAALGEDGGRLLIDPRRSSAAIADAVTKAGGALIDDSDPAILPKARKNTAEQEGSRRAHRRDGIAVTRFLAWLDRSTAAEAVDEIGAVKALEAFRAVAGKEDGTELVDISFDTIAGAGPNGAIVHYRVTTATNRRLEPGNLFLVDSGGQYPDGTTDITRTVAIGEPAAQMRDRFTRVLKGHIAIATARFPAGTSGAQLDALARRALWDAGLDYDHGTGHGVGSFLSVHEEPARISKTGAVALEPGMILSNEPGYYLTGAYGIRIENLLLVTPAAPIAGGDRPMLGFETLTLAPIDLALIDAALLSPAERAWLDAYHARVRAALSPALSPADQAWLAAATRPLA